VGESCSRGRIVDNRIKSLLKISLKLVVSQSVNIPGRDRPALGVCSRKKGGGDVKDGDDLLKSRTRQIFNMQCRYKLEIEGGLSPDRGIRMVRTAIARMSTAARANPSQRNTYLPRGGNEENSETTFGPISGKLLKKAQKRFKLSSFR